MSKLPDIFTDPEDSQLVADAKKDKPEDHEFTYTERDVILYNLGVGATAKDLQWTYESHDEFAALTTFGVILQFAASSELNAPWGLNHAVQAKLLHGEQYLAIRSPIPTEGHFVNETRLLEVLDKGKAASVTTIVERHIRNQITVFIRGAGGFGRKRSGKDRGAATAANTPPKRQPGAVIEEKTNASQAALYRLSGDYNPLHIDSSFAAIGGFDQPILHGLCFTGIAGKHVLQSFGAYKDIKVSFSGETLITEM
ncbi:HotDog domain-containing protein [Suillus paluster]|uniref:HotDog domain-containing protein n=1 Tax=Suillus paluster TaxID=48578 RepID=UPI001B871D42|nr:HotDog domain-containing protein [Suillus paluster]KAG1738429.1 HotDog domain-containing protein [Suillus paluster]